MTKNLVAREVNSLQKLFTFFITTINLLLISLHFTCGITLFFSARYISNGFFLDTMLLQTFYYFMEFFMTTQSSYAVFFSFSGIYNFYP